MTGKNASAAEAAPQPRALTTETARQVAGLQARRTDLLVEKRKADLALEAAQRKVADLEAELTKVEWAIDGVALGQQLERDRQQAAAGAAEHKGD